jgi:hypothetical protein
MITVITPTSWYKSDGSAKKLKVEASQKKELVDIMYDGSAINTSAPKGVKTNYDHNILIQSLSISRQEKNQVIETFGDHYVYFFGERPPSATINAMLLDTETFEWFQQFDMNYQTTYRGTQNAVKRKPLSILTDDLQIVGYFTGVQYSQSAVQDPYMVNVNISMILDRIIHLSDIEAVKTSKNSETNREAVRKLSAQTDVYNKIAGRFKSLEDELAFLQAEATGAKSQTEIDKGISEIVDEYRKTVKTDSYFNANPGEYIYGNFDGVFASIDDITDNIDSLTAQSILKGDDLEYINTLESSRIRSIIANNDKAINIDSPESVGVYIDGVISDESLVDIVSDALGSALADNVTPGVVLKSKQGTSMASSLLVYGLLNAASYFTSAIDSVSDATSGVISSVIQSVDGALGGQTQDTVREPEVGEFV